MSNWFLTATGKTAYVEYPKRTIISLVDIARSLSMQCRFGGHVRSFYSVAQHSLHVSRLVPAEYAREALLHDASEAYLGDVIRPLKMLLSDYQRLEHAWELHLSMSFQLSRSTDCLSAVKVADRVALVTERKHLLAPSILAHPIPWREDELGYDSDEVHWLVPMLPDDAERLFVARCVELHFAECSWLEPHDSR